MKSTPLHALPVILAALMFFGTRTVQSQTNTNITTFAVSIERIAASITKDPDDNSSLWELFSYAMPQNGQQVTYRTLGYSSHMSLVRDAFIRDVHGRPEIQSRGEDIFGDTILNSLRDSFMIWLKLDRFEPKEPMSEMGIKLIQGSIGGTLEEARRDAISLQPDDFESMKRWLDSFTSRNRVHYGIKIFEANPYAYFEVGLGEQKNDRPVLFWRTRFQSMPFSVGERGPRIKSEIAHRLGRHTQLSYGTAFYPLDQGRDAQMSFGGGLTYELSSRSLTYLRSVSDKQESIIHAGFAARF